MSESDLRQSDLEERVRQLEQALGILLAGARLGDALHLWPADPVGRAFARTRTSLFNFDPTDGLPALRFPALAAPQEPYRDDLLYSLAAQLDEMRETASVQQARFDVLQRSHQELRHHYALTLLQLSHLESLAAVPLTRAVRLSVYLGATNPEQGEGLFWSLMQIVGVYGFDLLDLEEPVLASWFRKSILKTKDVLTSREVTDRLGKIEQGLELKHIEQVRAERDKAHSEALLNMSKATEGQDRAVIVVGAIVMVKTPSPGGGSTMIARTLTTEQQKVLEQNPQLAFDPEGMRRLLDRPSNGDRTDTDVPTPEDDNLPH